MPGFHCFSIIFTTPMGLSVTGVFWASVWIELSFSPRRWWSHSSVPLTLIPPFTTPLNIRAGEDGSLEIIPLADGDTCLIFPEHLTTETIKSFA